MRPHASLKPSNLHTLLNLIYHNNNHLHEWHKLSIVKVQRRFAGHSHWANIKVAKQANDHSKSMRFNLLVNQIRLAIRDGNGNTNPESNDRLAQALKMAKVNSLPRATIDKVIKRWQAGEQQAVEPFVLPVQGPAGSFILVECVSDRQRDTQSRLNHLLKKCAMSMGELHTMAYAFDRKGVIRVLNSEPFLPEEPGTTPVPFITLDRAEEIAIEIGAEEVKMSGSEDDGSGSDDGTPRQVLVLDFICDLGDFHKVNKALGDNPNMPIKSAQLEYVANRLVTLEQNIDRNLVLRLFDQLQENFEALSKIYTNIDPKSLYPPLTSGDL